MQSILLLLLCPRILESQEKGHQLEAPLIYLFGAWKMKISNISSPRLVKEEMSLSFTTYGA
jgi:hypothetical protein